MPIVAPMMKVQACISYGANVIIKGNDISEVSDHMLVQGRICWGGCVEFEELLKK
jgi:hypothetical protein